MLENISNFILRKHVVLVEQVDNKPNQLKGRTDSNKTVVFQNVDNFYSILLVILLKFILLVVVQKHSKETLQINVIQILIEFIQTQQLIYKFMDVNAILQERKRLRIQKPKISECQLQRKFRQKQQYYNQELTEKLGKDILAVKKQQFNQNLFATDQNTDKEKEETQLSQNQQQQNQEIKLKKKIKRKENKSKKYLLKKMQKDNQCQRIIQIQ